MIILKTNYGDIKIELDTENTPNTSQNFLDYVTSEFYNGTIFHRVIDGFMIQGGGFTPDMKQKTAQKPIENEADKCQGNLRGTIAMARTSDPNSATSQFFINVKDNHFLNFTRKTSDGWGYCVFGKVTEGMDIVDKIAKTPTTSKAGHNDVPKENVTIESIQVID